MQTFEKSLRRASNDPFFSIMISSTSLEQQLFGKASLKGWKSLFCLFDLEGGVLTFLTTKAKSLLYNVWISY